MAALLRGGGQPIYAVNFSVWLRYDSESNPRLGYYQYPERYSAGQPITPGWVSHELAQLGFTGDCRVAPMDVRRPHCAAISVRDGPSLPDSSATASPTWCGGRTA